jgi:hypothetical protein
MAGLGRPWFMAHEEGKAVKPVAKTEGDVCDGIVRTGR